MPPKKENKKQALSKPDNSGIQKQDIEFKFSLKVKSDASDPPPYAIMFEWFGSLSDRLERIETGLLDSWKKDQSGFIFQREFDLLRIDDDFCQAISGKQFYLYFVNGDDCRVQDILLIDYSSLLMPAQNPQFTYSSRTIRALGIDQFSIRVTADKPLLSETYRHYLNPFQVEVIGAKDVPFDQSSRYQPAYVKYQLFDAPPVVTHCTVGSNRLLWQHKHVFILGLMDSYTLKQKIRSKYVKFQLHDRDQTSNRKIKADLEVFDVTRAIQEEIERQRPVQEDIKKKGAAKKQEKKEAKKDVKKDVKKKDAKLGDPILPLPIETISNNFGIAVFSLVEFLKPSVRNSRYKAAVVPCNVFEDLQSFNIDLNTTARNEMQKIFTSNNYFDCDTELVVGFTLANAIGSFIKPEQKEEVVQDSKKKKQAIKQIVKEVVKEEKVPQELASVFERIIYVIPYNDHESLTKIQAVFYNSNMKAFNLKSRRQITTYLLKKEEQDSLKLDFVTGLQIADPQGRIFIVQGIKDKCMQQFHQVLKKDSPNTRICKYLQNTTLSFKKRLFSDFHLQLKRIRLRPCLSQLLLEPSLYIKSKVPQQIYINLNKLSDIRKVCDDLATVDSLNLWPSAECLIKIQRKFSQSLSQADLTGGDSSQVKDDSQTQSYQKNIQLLKQSDLQVITTDDFFLPKIAKIQAQEQISTLNPFQGTKRTVMTKTFTRDQGKLVQTYQMRGRSANIPMGDQVYIYGGQKNNFYQKQLAELREQMKRNPNVLYTYSRDHFNLAIEPRNLKEEIKQDQQLILSKMYSKDKFSSLLVRTKEERMRLPNKPSEEDIRNLKDYPYYEQKAREAQARKNGRDAPIPNGNQDFKKYLKPQDIFSQYSVMEGERLSPVERQMQEKQQAKRDTEQKRLKMKGEPVIHLKKAYLGQKSYGVDRFKDIRQGEAKKLGLLDYDKNSHEKRPVEAYQVSFNLKQQTGDPSFNPLIRRDNPGLNIRSQEFNFYQPTQILTRTQIHKPLKNVL